jgi:hypothetical protein
LSASTDAWHSNKYTQLFSSSCGSGRRCGSFNVNCVLLLVLAGGEVSYAEHIAPLRAAGSDALRCVLVSATLPQHTFDELQELFMGLGAAFGPGLHRTATGERCNRHLLLLIRIMHSSGR